jgi:hypothetical protein
MISVSGISHDSFLQDRPGRLLPTPRFRLVCGRRPWRDGAPVTDVDELSGALRALTGAPCWSALAGRGAGGTLVLDLGGKLRRVQPLKNPQLTDEQRMYTGELWLLVRCAWRLESAEGVVCSRRQGTSGVDELLGRAVTHVEVRGPARDALLWFGDDRRLTVFCDRATGDDDCYAVALPGTIVEVGAGGAIRREARFAPATLEN